MASCSGCDLQHRDWVSPAKKVLDALLEPTSVTESIVLKLLQADMLAARPYSKPQVVLELCDLAIDRCWNEVLTYLVRQGTVLEPLDHRSSLQNISWLTLWRPLECFKGIPIRGSIERPPWSLLHPKPEFHALIQSTRYERLATSGLESDEALCKKMMGILVEAGADSTAIHHGRGVASHIVILRNNPYSTKAIRKYGRNAACKRICVTLCSDKYNPNLEHVELLLRIGGYSVSAENSEGRTPLYIAAYMNETTQAMKLLLKYQLVQYLVIVWRDDVYEPATRTSPAFRVGTAQGCDPGYKKLILDILTDKPPFLWRPDTPSLIYLLRKGADPRLAKRGFNNLLHLICADRHGSDHGYHNDMAEWLGEASLDINAAGNGGCRPLHLAIDEMKRDFVLLLLEHRATADFDDDHCMAPLQVLCSKSCPEYDVTYSSAEIYSSLDDHYYQGKRGEAAFRFDLRAARIEMNTRLEQDGMFQELLHRDADPFRADASGRNALMLACEKGNTVLVAGIFYWLHQSSAVLAETALNATDYEGNSCLHIEALGGHIHTVKVLLGLQHLLQPVRNEWQDQAIHDKESARLDISTSNQEMQRQEDAYTKADAIPPFLYGSSIDFLQPHIDIKFTISNKKRMTEESITLPNGSVSEWRLTRLTVTNETAKLIVRTNKQGKTPLHCAAQNGRLDAVELLLELTDADVAATDTQGKTAAHLALENSYFDIYCVL
ncbi:putative ankyrin repeat-containing protein [Fusarium austroafricanum]|uniref:Putative ankyrin repeat-containing protein n=1 Tax=Fusarium austroafricanum TaxID=2364996 RepID=A0A8H4NGX8_9HYPO|nr:putative ankyrin repeat-containing protein [Fusarium austroafricanum]